MNRESFKKRLRSLSKAQKALVIPVTYLILFVSLIAIISATYSFAVIKIGSKGASLKAHIAKQNIQVLDNAVHAVSWSFGASEVVYMDDCGGTFQTEPSTKNLILNFTDEQTFYDLAFNSAIGKISYELEPSDSSNDGLFIRGDYRAIINQTAYTMTQLYTKTEQGTQNIILHYRPLATTAVIGTMGGKPLNLIRVSIINLNASQNLMLNEHFNLKITALNVTTASRQYDFSQPVSSLALKAILGETQSTVWLPISSNEQGAAVSLEVVVCYVAVQRVEA